MRFCSGIVVIVLLCTCSGESSQQELMEQPEHVQDQVQAQGQEQDRVQIQIQTQVQVKEQHQLKKQEGEITSSENAVKEGKLPAGHSTIISSAIKDPDPVVVSSAENQPSSIHDHKIWDEILKKYVTETGQVDYGSIKENSALLNKYLEQLNQNSIQSSWTMSQELAYWINAYNAFTIDLIIRNYPLQSIMDLDKPWDKKFIQLGDQHYSLNQIEHEIVRPKFKEPRIHFAFVCAAVSCPKLLNLAYTQDNLEKNLDAQARYFLNESGKNNLTGDPLKISQLFNWYGEDFTEGQTVIDFLNKYSGRAISYNVKIEYLEYNWELNE